MDKKIAVALLKKVHENGYSIEDIANRLDITQGLVRDIIKPTDLQTSINLMSMKRAKQIIMTRW